MLNPLKLGMPRRPLFWTFALVILIATAFAAGSSAQNARTRDRIYVVAHFDTMPPNAAAPFLLQYAEDSRKDKGAVRVEVYSEIGRTNHFVVVEVWENQQAFDAHEAAAHTKQFREQIQPILASPWDQRVDRNSEEPAPRNSR
jgi:quinol monooxygenase YgiN